MQPHLLTVLTFLPLLGVPALLFLRSEDHTWIKRIALAVSLAEFVISLFLIRGFVTANPGYQFEEIHLWIGSTIRYHMGVDGISLLRRGLKSLIVEKDQARSVFSETGYKPLGGLADLPNHAILDRGRVVGLWEYDPAADTWRARARWATCSPRLRSPRGRCRRAPGCPRAARSADLPPPRTQHGPAADIPRGAV